MSKKAEIDIRKVVAAHIKKKYGTQSKAAKEWGVSPAYVSSVLTGKKHMPCFMAHEAGYEAARVTEAWVKIPANRTLLD